MGKTSNWFRGLFGGQKGGLPFVDSDPRPPRLKKKWTFVRSLIEKDRPAHSTLPAAPAVGYGSYRDDSAADPYGDGILDPNKHAIAVAAATAAVAEAAVAAAEAAAAVVRLTTSSGRCASAAAVKIQSAFRGYLARRALKALKGLVKLQALVRGNIVRKQTAEALRCMQALVRAQARAQAARTCSSEKQKLPYKGSQLHLGPATPEKRERTSHLARHSKHENTALLKRNIPKKNEATNVEGTKDPFFSNMRSPAKWLDHGMDDESADKIVEVDSGNPHFIMKRSDILNGHSIYTTWPESPSKDSTAPQLSNASPSSDEMPSPGPFRCPAETDEDLASCYPEGSPCIHSALSWLGSAKKVPFTPSKSDYSGSFLSGYSDHPNYMANTESFRAKVRSHSAPKQRPEFQKTGSNMRFSVYGFGDAAAAKTEQRSSSVQVKFASKAYPGSGRLDKLGMPVQDVPANSRPGRIRF